MDSIIFIIFVVIFPFIVVFLLHYFFFGSILFLASLIVPFEVTFGRVLAMIITWQIMEFVLNPKTYIANWQNLIELYKKFYKEWTEDDD